MSDTSKAKPFKRIPKAELCEMREREEAATEGPWEWVVDNWHGGYSGIVGPDNTEVLFPNHCNDGDDGAAWFEDFPSEEDALLLVHSRTDLPRLLDGIDDAYAEIAFIRGHVAELLELRENARQHYLELDDQFRAVRAELDTPAARIAELEADLENYQAAGTEDRKRAEMAEARLGRFTTDEDPSYVSEGNIPLCIECGDLVTDCDNREYHDEIVAIRRGRLSDKKRIKSLEKIVDGQYAIGFRDGVMGERKRLQARIKVLEKLIRRIRPTEHDNDCPLRYELMDLPDRCDCEFYSINADINALLPKEKSDGN